MGEYMHTKGRYRADDSMAQLICDNHIMLLIMSRFGIALGFADKSISEVCDENGVDCTTFLAVSNLILRGGDSCYKPSLDGVNIKDLVRYLHSSHDHYLTSRLPKIGNKLREVLSDDKISTLIMRYFEDYILQIKAHLCYEEEKLFPYITKLIAGDDTDGYSVDEFCKIHDHIDKPLTEFKDVIIKYYSAENSEEVVSVIHDLLTCVYDLSQHNMVEDRLLVPLIRKIEADGR
ncbi:MAG: hemerythrin domain-containing protein [Rikenellaceae bacterium]